MTPKPKTLDTLKSRGKLTNTTYFILPVFKVPLIKLDEYGFIDSYLYDKHKPDIEPDSKSIYLLFRPKDDTQKIGLQKQIEDWGNNGFFLDDYDYYDGYLVVVLKFPDKYRDQYKLFIKGKYSMFSTEFQAEIPKKVVGILPSSGSTYEDDSLQFLVINKRVKLKNYWRDQLDVELEDTDEYWEKPNKETETMDIDKINQARINSTK